MVENLQALCIDTAYTCAVGVGVAVASYGVVRGSKLLARNARKLAAVSLIGAILVGGMVVVGTDDAGTKPGTNNVTHVEGETNAVTQVAGTNGTSSAAGPLMLGHFGRPNFAQGIPTTVTSDDIAQLWRIAATTDAGLFAEPTANAVTNAAWRDYGGMSDSLRIKPEGWCFPYGDKTTVGLTVFENGDFRPNVKTHFFPPPFEANLSLLPRSNWGHLPGGGESVFWHEQTPSNSLILTWHNALYNRDVNSPTNFQAELFVDGRFDYRYPDRTVRYAPVFPFDWDGDGLENLVDPEPLVAGPDAHGTNAEWYNVVCTNVFAAVEGAQGVELAPRTFDVKTNAYYFVDVVAQRGPAPIYFNSSHPGRLGSPVVVAYGGVTNRVPLLVGATYSVTSDVPFTVACPTNGFAEAMRPDGRNATICWPIEFTFTEGLVGATRTYTVDVEPYNPGGSFSWNSNHGGASLQGIVPPSTGGACGCVSGNGNTVTFGCSSTCACGGNCLAVGAFSFEYAVFAVTGGVCRCGFDDPPPVEPPCYDLTNGPAISIAFSRPAVLFEDAHLDCYGKARMRCSARVLLTISAYGGPNGAAMTLWQQNLSKLRAVGREMPTLPVVRELSANETYFESCILEGAEASAARNDIAVSGFVVDSSSQGRMDGGASLTVVELEVEADADYPAGKKRHVFGPKETAKIRSVPAGMAVISGTVPNEVDIRSWTTHAALTVGENVAAFTLTATVGSESFAIPISVIHPVARLEAVEVLPLNSSDWDRIETVPLSAGEAGAAGKIKVRLMPDFVSFRNLFVLEGDVPATNIWGCCTDEVLYPSETLRHNAEAGGAEIDHVSGAPVGCDNMLDFDRVCFWVNSNQTFPCQGGGFTLDIPWKWHVQGSVAIHDWMTVPQVFTISPNGTVSISKFGITIIREIGGRQSWNESE